jgi:uncharacterized protein (DUF169 family)
MIITPARFEDEMNKIVTSKMPKARQTDDAIELMLNTLESMGYGRGVAIFKDNQP